MMTNINTKKNVCGVGALIAGGCAIAEGQIVQITQTGNEWQFTGGTGSFSDNLSADLTGDGIDDITISDSGWWGGGSSPSPVAVRSVSGFGGVRINGTRALAGLGFFSTIGSITTCVSVNNPAATNTKVTTYFAGDSVYECYGTFLSVATTTVFKTCGILKTFFTTFGGTDGGFIDDQRVFTSTCDLIEISFDDPTYGGTVNAWLQVSQSASSGVFLERVIFDSANPLVRPTAACSDPVFTEAQPVPEPSSIGLLALGAGGVLLRRKRKAQVQSA